MRSIHSEVLVAVVLITNVAEPTYGQTAKSPASGKATQSVAVALPLAIGNSWTYVKRVPAGRRAAFRRVLGLTDGGSFVTTGGNVGMSGAVRCTEPYKVVAFDPGTKDWKVEIESAPMECKQASHGPRDGRYASATEVFWGTRPMADAAVAATIVEKIVFNRSLLPPGWREQVRDPIVDVREQGITWKTFAGPGGAVRVQMEGIGSNVKLTASNELSSVDTMAGRFTNCYAVTEDVKIEEGPDKEDPFATGWITQRYFCLGIGLVKETQTNRAANLLYTMELARPPVLRAAR